MNTTKLSNKGKVTIPKLIASHNWCTGQELVVIDMGYGILLKLKAPFPESSINDVASCLQFTKVKQKPWMKWKKHYKGDRGVELMKIFNMFALVIRS